MRKYATRKFGSQWLEFAIPQSRMATPTETPRPRSKGSGLKPSLQQVLAEQLAAQQQLQVAHHRRALLLVEELTKDSETVQSEAVRRSDLELQRLREENQKLKSSLYGLAVLPSCNDDDNPAALQMPGAEFLVSDIKGFSNLETDYDMLGPLRSNGLGVIHDLPLPPDKKGPRPKTPLGGSAVLMASAADLAMLPADYGLPGLGTSRPGTPSAWQEVPTKRLSPAAKAARQPVNGDVDKEDKVERDNKSMFLRFFDEDDSDDLPRRAMFNDVEKLKEQVRSTVTKKDTNVLHFYKTSGFAQLVARSSRFDQFTQLVILLNALWIAVETDYNHEVIIFDSHPVFVCMEFFFTVYFSFELFVRTLAFQKISWVLNDSWYMFDAILVLIMLVDLSMAIFTVSKHGGNARETIGNTSILKIVKLLRLLRVTRMARLLRAVPELMILIKGMVMATRSVVVTLCLLVLLIYIYAIVMTQLTLGTELGDVWFGKVPRSMATLFLHGCFAEDLPSVAYDTGGELEGGHLYLAVLLMMFVLLASLTVMNMLVGVLVDVVSTVSKVEKEELSVNLVKSRLHKIIDNMDDNQDGTISRMEFEQMLVSSVAAKALAEVGVDVVALVDLEDFLFEDSESLPLRDFMEMVLQLRGTNTATVKDIVDLRKWIGQELGRVNQNLGLVDSKRSPKTYQVQKANFSCLPTWNVEEV